MQRRWSLIRDLGLCFSLVLLFSGTLSLPEVIALSAFLGRWWLSFTRTVPLSQVSKTDPSPKREAPTMILFNVVFALRVSV